MSGYQWHDFELDESTDAIPGKYVLEIVDSEGEEYAVIVHRASERFPIDGELAEQKRQRAEHIVASLNGYSEKANY